MSDAERLKQAHDAYRNATNNLEAIAAYFELQRVVRDLQRKQAEATHAR